VGPPAGVPPLRSSGSAGRRNDGDPDPLQLLAARDVRRHCVDEVVEGAQPDAVVEGGDGGPREVDGPLELDDPDRASTRTSLATDGATALLCVERDPQACHRSLLAERLAAERGVSVTHLTP
jgi:Protein of unknown function, DUF488